MMELKRIALADVRPNEKNPRGDFGDLETLWESFAFNSANPGEPVNPIVVVADGNVYRIVDGERRYRAMSGHGQETCMAVVCEDYDDMEQAVQMLATDDKLSLTPEEQCVGIQQMLLLGVDEERISGVSHETVDTVRKIRNVVNCRGYAGEREVYQATVDQMLAVADVDENGDGDLADEMLAGPGWERKYTEFCRERRAREEYESMRAAALEAGFVLLEEGFDADDYGPMRYVHGTGDFAELYEKGYRFAEVEETSWGCSSHAYLPAGAEPGQSEAEAAEDRARAEREAKREQAEAALDALRAEMAVFWAENMSLGVPQGACAWIARETTHALFDPKSGELAGDVAAFTEISGRSRGFSAPPQLTWELKAIAFGYVCPVISNYYSLSRAVGLGIDNLEEWSAKHAVESAEEVRDIVNLFVANGFEPSPASDELMRKISDIADWVKDEGDEKVVDE